MFRRLVCVIVATGTALLVAAPGALGAPTSLSLPQSAAFSILGHSCGGIQEKSYATGFDATSGYPTGDVHISTSCGGSGRGGGYHSTTYSAWVAVTWDFTAAMVSYATASGPVSVDPTFSAYDANGNQVYNQTGNAYLVLADGYVPAPRFISMSISTGPAAGGTSVSIAGTGFTNATAVSFGGTPAAGFVINSDDSITAVSPTAAPGTVDVTVTSAGGTSATSAGDQFTFVAAPVVSAVTPNSGPLGGGTTVTITGANLSGADSVTFGGTYANFSVNGDGSLTASAPASEEAGQVDVTVTSVGGTSATGQADRFTYVSGAAPIVSAVSPRFGSISGDNTVTILGSNFTPDATVQFGSSPADSTYISSTRLTAVAPGGSRGAVDVTVNTLGGTSAIGVRDLFAYGAPAISTFAPSSGITGSTVSITGSGFAPGLVVRFGALRSPAVNVLSGTTALATVPNGATPGAVTVADPQGSAASAARFVPTLSITSISPASGPAGTVVVIRGIGLQPNSVVRFNGVTAPSVAYVSSSELKAAVPAAATTGRITLTNTSAPAGTVRSVRSFTVT